MALAAPGVDLKGQRFGNLVVIEKVKLDYAKYRWRCKCDCGNETLVNTYHLQSGQTKSCGCQHLKWGHGHSNERIYHIWCSMKARCGRKSSAKYSNYGARGITVCDEWQHFEPFYEWAMNNGYSDNLSLDRIDNNGNYGPDNCRWATAKQQANNTRKNRRLLFCGEQRTIAEIADMSGIPYKLLYKRITRGWDIERAVRK